MSSRETSRRCRHGYSLVEVLVAMVILSLALTVLMRIFSAGLISIDRASDFSQAVMVAESRLASAGSTAEISPGRTFGTQDRFTWTQTIEPYMPEGTEISGALSVNAYIVTVVVEWMTGSRSRNLRLSTVRLTPSPGMRR